jgi:hypothetical protein
MEGDLMYQKIEGNLRMTVNEASEKYPDSFVVIRRDNKDLSNMIGNILYVGDNFNELFSLISTFDDPSLCGVIEGLNHQCSLGGVVVGE